MTALMRGLLLLTATDEQEAGHMPPLSSRDKFPNRYFVIEQIKKNPDFKSIPVLMLTGTRFTAAAAKQYQIFMDDYIMKPFQPLDLYAAIDQILTRKQKVKESLVLATKAGVHLPWDLLRLSSCL